MSRAAAVLLGMLAILGRASPTQAQSEASPAASATASPAAPSPAADSKVYGEYPIAYKEIVGRWLETKLADPMSAVIDWLETPRPGEYTTQKGDRFVGYVFDIKVNARNQFGAPTGKQRYRVVIRNGEVVWGGRPRY